MVAACNNEDDERMLLVDFSRQRMVRLLALCCWCNLFLYLDGNNNIGLVFSSELPPFRQ